MGEPVFDKRTIARALTAVAARLEAAGAAPAVLIVAGGSFMAVHELRASTRDVDSMTRLTDAVREAVAAVAAELGSNPTG